MAIQTLGIIGAGQMGVGIAQVAAQSGLDVIVVDASRELAERGVGRLRSMIEKLVARGKLDGTVAAQVTRRVRAGDGFADLASCDFVIEAATEKQELKLELFRKLDGVAKADAILASNTSSISITLLGAQTKRPERV